jgi:hypothetical protein
MPDAMDAAWATLRAHLEMRGRELYEQVRTYPTPIARCDVQLTKLIEERDAAFRRLQRAEDLDALRVAVRYDEWLAAVREFLASLNVTADAAAAIARERIVAAPGC